MPIRVSSIQRGCVHDGDGLRTTVFLHGCKLKCPWCCNPETIYGNNSMFDKEKCQLILKNGSDLCIGCVNNCGNKPISNCPFSLERPSYRIYSTNVLYEECIRDNEYFLNSGGGVTFSGGEPMLQANAIKDLCIKLKSKSIHIAVETTLIVDNEEAVRFLLPFIDELIIDLKLQPVMFLFDSEYLEKISNMLNTIGSVNRRFRMVFINSMMDYIGEIRAALAFLNIKSLEILACHNLGHSKYEKLGLEPKDYSANLELLNKFSDALTGIQCKTLTA